LYHYDSFVVILWSIEEKNFWSRTASNTMQLYYYCDFIVIIKGRPSVSMVAWLQMEDCAVCVVVVTATTFPTFFIVLTHTSSGPPFNIPILLPCYRNR
jgi:predicted RNA-binding protein